MNVTEGIDLVKMAIIVLLVVLLLGTVITIAFKYSDYSNSTIKSLEDAAESSKMERLYELQDLSNSSSKNNPLVTAVSSVLSEFDETDLLYIAVVSPDDTRVYTYEGVTLTGISGSTTVHTSSSPTSHAYKHLLQFSKCRCKVTVNDITSLTEHKYSASDNKMLAIVINIIRE